MKMHQNALAQLLYNTGFLYVTLYLEILVELNKQQKSMHPFIKFVLLILEQEEIV